MYKHFRSRDWTDSELYRHVLHRFISHFVISNVVINMKHLGSLFNEKKGGYQ